MNTRHANNGNDPGHAPERNLSSMQIRPITVSLAIAAQACRVYPKPAREACLWLANLAANSQRIQLCWQKRGLQDPIGTIGRIAEADLCDKLGLQPIEIYRALTGHAEAELEKFVGKVSAFRKTFESNFPPLARTKDRAKIEEAFEMAAKHRITLIQGRWRHGKTVASERIWLENLHDTIWVRCPSDNFERTFLNEIARALGIGANVSKRPPQLKQQIKNALGVGLISRVVIDQAHELWPRDVANQKPIRIEFVMELRDELGVGFVLISTDQFALNMEICKAKSGIYSPGQFDGRLCKFELRAVHTDDEIKDIISLHAGGNITDDALGGLLNFVQQEEGYLGAGIECLANARRRAGNNGAVITLDHVVAAGKNQRTSDRIKALALPPKPASVTKKSKRPDRFPQLARIV